MIRTETKATEPTTAERPARRRPPGSAYWLIAKVDGGTEVLTLGGDEVLPVFSFEEEAEMFLRLASLGGAWRVRRSGTGELVSVLYGPCAGVKEVALDHLPQMMADRTVGLVALRRERFMERIMAGRRL